MEKFGEKLNIESEETKTLDKNLGFSFQIEGGNINDQELISGQLKMIEKNRIGEAQIQLRRISHFENIKILIDNFRQKNPETNLSFHISSPDLSENGEPKFRNKERIERELEIAEDGDVITVHPLSYKVEDWKNLSPEEKQVLIEKFSKAISLLISENKRLDFAIENMGQTPKDMRLYLEKLKQNTAGNIGITLDLDHVRAVLPKNINDAQKLEIFEKWFSDFRDEIRCLHLSVPNFDREEDERRFQLTFSIIKNLYAKYNLSVPLYLETKRDLKTSQKAFDLAKNSL